MSFGDVISRLSVALRMDTGDFIQGSSRAQREMANLGDSLRALGEKWQQTATRLSVGLTAPFAAFSAFSIKAASDAAELQSAFDQTFGTMAEEMNAWAIATGDAMGRSTQSIQEMANSFGILFNQTAPTRQAAAEMSKTFAVLAQDLSSFYNLSGDDVLQKLRSGIVGETEPLRAFGVLIDDATVKAKALEMGLAETAAEVSEQAKVMARYQLILEKTANAQGDVARTSDGTANRMRSFTEAMEELRVAIGSKLLPVITPLIKGITSLINAFTNLPSWVQTVVVAMAGFAAALGPLMLIIGGLAATILPLFIGRMGLVGIAITALINPLGTAAVVVGRIASSMGGLSLAVRVLRVAFAALTTTLGPYILAGAAVAGILYLLFGRTDDAAKASGEYREQQERLRKVQERTRDATEKLATATGKARKEALANAKALRQESRQYLEKARSALIAARATARQKEIEASQIRYSAGAAMSGGSALALGGNFVGQRTDRAARQAQTDLKVARETVKGYEEDIKSLNAIINAATPVIDTPKPTAGNSSTEFGGSIPGSFTGFDEDAMQQRYLDQMTGYMAQIASVRGQQAKSAEEAAEYELRGVELARIATLRSIDNDAKSYAAEIEASDLSAEEKALLQERVEANRERLRNAVETAAIEERLVVEFRKQMEIERDMADMAGVEFDNRRDLLNLQADVADTQAERKRIALDILKLEQDYRRNQLDMVVASQTASDAEKARAQAILDSLAAIEAGELASVNRANETEIERYLREANKTPQQMGEARAGISLDGVDRLLDGLSRIPGEVDSVNDAFKAMKDVFQGVIQDMLAALLKLQLQKAVAGLLGSAAGVSIPGFATGTSFAPGGLALVGERGPELVNLPRGSQVFPNGQTERMLGGQASQNIFHITVTGPMSEGERRETGSQIARAAQRRMANAARSGLA